MIADRRMTSYEFSLAVFAYRFGILGRTYDFAIFRPAFTKLSVFTDSSSSELSTAILTRLFLNHYSKLS